MKMYLRFSLILIFFNVLTSGEFIVLEPSEGVEEKFLLFNIETDVVPNRYHIEIDLDEHLDFQYFNGTSKIRFLSRVDSKVLNFHFNKSTHNQIYAIRLTNIDRNVNIDFKNATHFWSNYDALIGLEFGDGLILEKNNLYDLYVEYMVKFADEVTTGFFKTCVPISDNNKSCYVTTHFESIHFRDNIPSFDVIALKAQFNIQITHNSELVAISNMPANIITRFGSLVTTQFEETPIMSTYIVAFTVGKFLKIPIETPSNITMNVYIHYNVDAGLSSLHLYSGKIIHALEKYLNVTYALPKLDLLATRTASKHLKGMENWGLITLDEKSVLENTLIPSSIFDDEAIELISHELVHQFFGNLVTMKNITYLWLNEGFAMYLSYRILAELLPKENYMERVFSRDVALVQWIENLLPITILNDFQPRAVPNRKMYVYPKGCIIVNVLRHVLGELPFQTAMQIYIKKFAYGVVTPDDLIDVIQETNDIYHTIPSDINIREFINSWINQNRFPILNVKRNYTSGDVIISQVGFKINNNESDQIWSIPFNYATKSKPNFYNTLPDGWLRNSSMTLPLNLSTNDWIIFNKQQSGNYIVNYDEHNWRLIVEAMNGDDFEIIPPIERARTISDAHYLSQIASVADTNIFYNLLMILKKDRSHVTWNVIDRILKLYLTKEIATNIGINKLNYFKPAYDSLGFELLDEDSLQKRITKIIVTNWACLLQYDKCLNDMNKISEQYLKSIEKNEPLVLDESILKNIFQYGFTRDEAFEQIITYINSSSNVMLKELFYYDPDSFASRPQFQLHYMLTVFNLTYNNSYTRPALDFDASFLAKFNEFDMFSVCVLNSCYDFNQHYFMTEQRNQLIDSLVARVIRKIERDQRDINKINKMLQHVEFEYNVHFNYNFKNKSDLNFLDS